MTRRLVVWRHGETAHNATGVYQGQLDTELSEVGSHQVTLAAPALQAYRPSRIVSSDLRRAADTARALADLSGLPVTYDVRLREIDVGAWSGMTRASVGTAYPGLSEAIDRGEDPVRGGHGEQMADVAVRTAACARDVVAAMGQDEVVVLATHGQAARALVAGMIGLDHQLAWRALAGLHNTHWAELVEHTAGWRLAGWNLGGLTPPPRDATH